MGTYTGPPGLMIKEECDSGGIFDNCMHPSAFISYADLWPRAPGTRPGLGFKLNQRASLKFICMQGKYAFVYFLYKCTL
jgi:hypothetical protein